MTEKEKKELEGILETKVKNTFSEITTEFEYERPQVTLAVSKLKVVRCYIGSYINVYNTGRMSVNVYIRCDGCSWALDNIKSLSKDFENPEEITAYINSDRFIEDVKASDIWKYCTDEEYQKIVIETYTKTQLNYFEREFMGILENVGAKEIMRILSPLNQIVSYGGDFEAIAQFVSTISKIMEENRRLKLNQK